MSSSGDSNGGEAIPRQTARLFPHHHHTDLGKERHLSFLVGSLLEYGDSRDLRWLVESCGEHRLAEWTAARGGRQLSGRSRAFWTTVLGLEALPTGEDPLWPV